MEQNNSSTRTACLYKIYGITLFFFISAIKLMGQYNYINDPGTVNMLLSQKNDFSIMALTTKIDRTVLIGYSPVNNTSIKIGYFNSGDNNSWVKTRGNIYSFSIGTYYLVNTLNMKNDDGFLLYLNTGYSLGKITNEWRNEINEFRTEISEFRHQKIFIDTGVRAKWKFIAGNLNFKQTRIEYTDGKVIGRIYAPTRSTMDELNKRKFFYSLEMNLSLELSIRQGGIILGFPVFFRNGDKMISNILYRESYIGLVVNIG